MSFWSAFSEGLISVASPLNLMLLVVGVVVGFVVGALPGFGASNAAALLLPFTIGMPADSALILMSAIYCGTQYGGAVPAILMNAPGQPGSAATSLDGFPMAQRGEAGKALGIARMASTMGGVMASLIVIPIIMPLSKVALKFGPPEMFMLALLGLTLIAGVSEKSVAKSLAVGFLGMVIASMAADPLLATPRLTFGFLELYEGVPFVPALVGLFTIGELIYVANEASLMTDEALNAPKESWKDAAVGAWETLKYPVSLIRSTLIGLIVGLIPGTGASVSNFIAYGEEKRWSKHPEKFGKGAPEGIIASEAADNGVTAACMVPTFALGVPGGGTTAIMLAALMLHGIQPGPDVMTKSSPMVYAVLISILLANLAILPFGLILGEALKQVTRVPLKVLIPAVIILSSVGAFAERNSMFDVVLVLVFGVVGFILRSQNYPIVPLVLGLVLGPVAESALAQSLALSRGSYAIFFSRPVSLIMWGVVLLTLVGKPLYLWWRNRRRAQSVQEAA